MLVANRGRMMQELPKGSMLSVRLSANELSTYLTPDLSIAAINGPSLSVVSGNDKAIDTIQLILESKEIICKKLFTSHAFHSPMMDPIVEPFNALVSKVKLNPPTIPVVSTATSEWLTDEQATDPGYWSKHLRLPVRFADGIKTIWQNNPSLVLLEMGPRNTASTLAKQQATDLKKQFAFPSLPDTSDNDAEWNTMLMAIGQLWLSGISINWNDFYALEQRKHIPLSTYPFELKRYWVDPVPTGQPLNTFHPYNPFVSDEQYYSQEQFTNTDFTQNIISTNMNTPSRKDRIIAELKSVMEEASGIELATADSSSSFMELGMDSLFLTQAALTISKKYGTKITFRQLNESFSSLDALSDHLDKSLPADAVQAPAPAPVAQQRTSIPQSQPMQFAAQPAGNGAPGSMQWLINQQLQVMQQQLAMMGGMNAAPAMMAPPPMPVQPQESKPVAASGNTNPGSSKLSLADVSENEKAELSKPFGAIARIEKAASTELSAEQKKWISDFTARYNAKTAKSKSYTQAHRAHLADPRVVTGFKPTIKELIYQVVVDRSLGCRMWDLDGNEYVDVLNGFGSNF
ncbi:acyltransferase domain-containing protein, partial [Dolichospermum sp. ST_sed3]|nr:acyltransferase domain-containing protein [Dolichospermum sp. ST_sed3]